MLIHLSLSHFKIYNIDSVDRGLQCQQYITVNHCMCAIHSAQCSSPINVRVEMCCVHICIHISSIVRNLVLGMHGEALSYIQ